MRDAMALASPFCGVRMTNQFTALSEAALGTGALLWATLLLPSTGFLWWLAGTVAYGALALLSAAALWRSHAEARALAAIGIVLFAVSNSFAAGSACTGGGACAPVVGVVAAIIVLQLTLIAVPQH